MSAMRFDLQVIALGGAVAVLAMIGAVTKIDSFGGSLHPLTVAGITLVIATSILLAARRC